MRVLIAEDEKKVAGHICHALHDAGFAADVVYRGDEALALAEATRYDAFVLDIMMPGCDGLNVLRRLRAQRQFMPILLLTARGEVSERVEGLMLGADDYLSKPFSMEELIARVHSLTRRAGREQVTLLEVHDLTMNLLTREVRRNGSEINLPAREFALLECLMRNGGQVLSRTHLIERVWEHHYNTGSNIVDVYIQRLRRKIDGGQEIKLLHTIRGVGYILKAPR